MSVAVIAIHGNGGGGFRFQRAAQYFPSDVKFVAPTLPGFAGEPRDAALKTINDYGNALRIIVEREPRPRILLGHGIGGSLGLQLAQQFPDALDGIILHAPVGAFLDRRQFPQLMLLPGVARLGKAIFTNRLLRPYFAARLFAKDVPRDYVEQFFNEYVSCTVFEEMFHLITHQWFSSLGPIALPACILWGGQDRVLSSTHAPEFAKLFPHSSTQIVEAWTHWPMIEQPQDYATVVARIARELAAR